MSRLSGFFKNKRYLVEEAVAFLETYGTSITGSQKAKIVVDLMKALHIAEGGIWGSMLKNAVMMAIDYELARIREHPYVDHPPVVPILPPIVTSIYDIWSLGVLPSNADLIGRGFKSGDVKYTNNLNSYWLVSHAGGIPNSPPTGTLTEAGFIA